MHVRSAFPSANQTRNTWVSSWPARARDVGQLSKLGVWQAASSLRSVAASEDTHPSLLGFKSKPSHGPSSDTTANAPSIPQTPAGSGLCRACLARPPRDRQGRGAAGAEVDLTIGGTPENGTDRPCC